MRQSARARLGNGLRGACCGRICDIAYGTRRRDKGQHTGAEQGYTTRNCLFM